MTDHFDKNPKPASRPLLPQKDGFLCHPFITRDTSVSFSIAFNCFCVEMKFRVDILGKKKEGGHFNDVVASISII